MIARDSLNRIRYILFYAFTDLLPLRLAGETASERMNSFLAASKRWLTTALNVFTLTTLIVAALVIGGLVIGTTRLIREFIEANPMALVIEVYGGMGASVKTISEEDEQKIRSFSWTSNGIQPTEGGHENGRVIHHVAGWNDVGPLFWKKDGSRDKDFTPGRTVQPGDPVLGKLRYLYRSHPSVLFSDGDAPEIIVTAKLLEQLGYDPIPTRPPKTLQVNYRDTAAPLRLVAVAEWIPSGDLLLTEAFYRRFRDRQWVWPPMHHHAYLGPVSADQSQAILQKATSYFNDQNVEAIPLERAGSAKWLRAELSDQQSWPQSYWEETFFPTLALYLGNPAWYSGLSVEFDDPLPLRGETRIPIDIGFTRASVYAKQLSDVPGVVDALTRMGLKVDDRIAQEVVFLQQISSFGRRIFAWVVGAVAVLAAVNIGLSFAQTIHRKQAQIGILRAFGASRRFIFSIYICEATFLWILAAVLGLIIAFPAGQAIGNNLMKVWENKGVHSEIVSDQENPPVFFRAPAGLLVLTLGGALVVSWLATTWAAAKAARVNPAIAVRSRE